MFFEQIILLFNKLHRSHMNNKGKILFLQVFHTPTSFLNSGLFWQSYFKCFILNKLKLGIKDKVDRKICLTYLMYRLNTPNQDRPSFLFLS